MLGSGECDAEILNRVGVFLGAGQKEGGVEANEARNDGVLEARRSRPCG